MSESRTIKLAFCGDICLNDDYRRQDGVFISGVFSALRRALDERGVDRLIINLESPLLGNGSVNLLKNPRVCTDGGAIMALATLRPDLAVLANNHIYDCLEQGYDSTLAWLTEHGIAFTGAGKEPLTPHRFSVQTENFSLLSYVAADTHPCLPDGAAVRLPIFEENAARSQIRREAGQALVIVSLHWGEEFSHYPSARQRDIARGLIDAGAALVIGHHAHVIQGLERYRQGFIFYNLGNCAFSDVRETDAPVLWTRDQRHGALALVQVRHGRVTGAETMITDCSGLAVRVEDDPHWKKLVERRSRPFSLPAQRYEKFWRGYHFRASVLAAPLRFFFGERRNFFRQVLRLRAKHLVKAGEYLRRMIRGSGHVA